jgi:RES domain-containing protein
MPSKLFEENTEEEQIGIFREFFDRDIEYFFSSSIACCEWCKDDFQERWPGTASHDLELQRGYMTIADFLLNSRIQDTFSPEDIARLSQSLVCPNCDAVLNGEFWIFEHPFRVPDELSTYVGEIADIASRTPFLLLTHTFAREVFDVILALGRAAILRKNLGSLFRARSAEDLSNPAFCDFSAPPAHEVVEGRYNHAGNPMIYLAESERTAFAEIASPRSRVHVAEIVLNASLKILDLRIQPEAETRSEIIIQCLARSALCAAPRKGEGWLKREYVFTRFVADCARYAGFDAIRYGSTKDHSGANLVLLNAPARLDSIASLIAIRTRP